MLMNKDDNGMIYNVRVDTTLVQLRYIVCRVSYSHSCLHKSLGTDRQSLPPRGVLASRVDGK